MMSGDHTRPDAGWRPRRFCIVATAAILAVWIVGAPVATRTTLRAAAASAYRLVRVDPCQTDRALRCDSTKEGTPVPHLVYVPVHLPVHPLLAVFFPGTGARPTYYTPVAQTLAQRGWFVIDLRYTTSVATEQACPNATYRSDPNCYRRFRSESIFGEKVPDPTGHAYDYVGTHVAQADSVLNRLLKLVGYLHTHPALAGADWGQFLALHNGKCSSYNATYGACNLDWSRIALGGHSQGAGVALYLAKFYKVTRVAMLSGPEDAYPLPGRIVVASWITEGHFATAPARIYGFTHKDDPFYARQTSAWAALRLPGSLTSYVPDHPVSASHRLTTSIDPGCPQFGTALAAHSATAVVGCVALPGYSAVWASMYGSPS